MKYIWSHAQQSWKIFLIIIQIVLSIISFDYERGFVALHSIKISITISVPIATCLFLSRSWICWKIIEKLYRITENQKLCNWAFHCSHVFNKSWPMKYNITFATSKPFWLYFLKTELERSRLRSKCFHALDG